MEIDGLTVSSEATGFSKENLLHRWHTWCWRSTGVVSEWVKRNLWEAYAISYIIIKNHNFTSDAVLKIQANTTDSWAAPPVDVTIPITADRIIKFFSPAETYQWWRILIADPGNLDGYLEMGRPYIGGYFEPINNFSVGSVKKLKDPSIKLRSSGGQYSVDEKEHYREWYYDFAAIEDPDQDTFEDIFDHVGQSEPYFIVEDADDAWETTYYVQNLKDWEIAENIAEETFALKIEVEEMR